MLLTRNEDRYQYILGVDIDPTTKDIADKITSAWRDKVHNVVFDANLYDFGGFDVVINASVEHMSNDSWFHRLELGTLVCIQSSDVTIADDEIWKCINPNPALDCLIQKYPLSKILYQGTKEIRYSEDNGYNRFMLIGLK